MYYNIGNKSVKKITFYDSLKIIPFSVDQVSKAFGLEESKLEIDYNLPREKGHVLTEEEIFEYFTEGETKQEEKIRIAREEEARIAHSGTR